MRPSKAYIASFSTTGLLIALAVLLLIVVGALMAFRDQAGADRGPGTSDVTVDAAEPARVGTLSERVAAREPAAPSTRGVVLTPAAPGPVGPVAPPAPLQVPVGTPGTGAPPVATAPAPAQQPQRADDEEQAPEDGTELGGGVGGVVEIVSPDTDETLADLLEQLDGTFPLEEAAPATSPDAQPAR